MNANNSISAQGARYSESGSSSDVVKKNGTLRIFEQPSIVNSELTGQAIPMPDPTGEHVLSKQIKEAIKRALTFALLLTITAFNVGCKTAKVANKVDGPLNGYVTLNAIAFTFDEKNVDIEVSFVPHYESNQDWTNRETMDPDTWGKIEIGNRVEKELKDIAEKTGFTYEQISNDIDNVSIKFHVGSYANANIFFLNLAARLRGFSSNSKEVFLPVLNAKFTHGSKHNEVTFLYSPGMFEQRAIISFKSMEGNIVSCNNVQSATIYSIANRFLEYVISPSVGDSLALNRTSLLRLAYYKKPAPVESGPSWYSLQRVRKIFESAPKPLATEKDKKELVPTPNFWMRTNDTVKWIIEIVFPILAFFGIINFKSLVGFLRRLFFGIEDNNAKYKRGYSA